MCATATAGDDAEDLITDFKLGYFRATFFDNSGEFENRIRRLESYR